MFLNPKTKSDAPIFLRKAYDAIAIIICLITAIIIYAVVIFGDKIMPNIDLQTHYRWLVQFQAALAEGTFYPRWMPLNNLGLGQLHYTPYPLYYYLASLLLGGGLAPWPVMKLMAVSSNFLGGVLVYFSLKNWMARRSALIGALFWQMAPFPFFLFMYHAAPPWQFSFLLATAVVMQSLAPPSRACKVRLALTTALLALAHVLVAFMTLLCLGVLMVWRLAQRPARFKPVALGWASPVALGVGLASFHLLPAMAAISLYHSFTQIDSTYLNWRDSFVFSTFSAAIWGTRWFVVQWIIPGIALLCLSASTYTLWRTRHHKDGAWTAAFQLSLFAGAGALFASEVAFPLYAYLGPFQALQWPYRFVTVISLGAALMLAFARTLARADAVKAWLCRGLCGLAFALTLLLLVGLELKLIREGSNPNLNPALLTGEFTSSGAVLKTTGPHWKDYVQKGGFAANCRDQQALCEPLLRNSQYRIWTITAANDAALVLPLFAFPGWTVQVDGVEVPFSIDPPTGLVAVTVPVGRHRLAIELTGLPQERVGLWISLASLAGLLVLIGYPCFMRSKS